MNVESVRNALLASDKYEKNEEGVWKIFGEDPNCDFGGYHHRPYLTSVKGTYRQAVEYALSLRNFFTWGGGGKILKVEEEDPTDLNSKEYKNLMEKEERNGEKRYRINVLNKKRDNLIDEAIQIQEEIKKIKNSLE